MVIGIKVLGVSKMIMVGVVVGFLNFVMEVYELVDIWGLFMVSFLYFCL